MEIMPDFDFKIVHRNWTTAFSHAYTALSFAEKKEVICIIGPSRAGKSTLLTELLKKLVQSNPSASDEMRVIKLIAANRGHNGSFSTRGWTEDVLTELDHPMLPSFGSRENETSLRRAAEQGFINRKVRFFCIDEAHHLGYANKGCFSAQAVADSWKCFTEATCSTLILCGGYPLLDILLRSPHLVGRVTLIHLPRYQSSPEDLREFAGILLAYNKIITLEEEGDSLINYLELLYEGSLGCIGLLRNWLRAACSVAIADQRNINRKILESTLRPENQLAVLREEIVRGEISIALPTSLTTLVDRLGGTLASEGVPKAKEKGGAKKRSSKPFQKSPRRLKAGNRAGGSGDA